MPDGFVRSPIIHAPGCYLGQPLDEYLADPALSGSAFKKLLSDPAGLYWESEANPLWLRPEKRADRARLRGSAAHCLILEGREAYAARYVVKPEGVLESSSDLKRWLSNKRAEFIANSVDGKLSREDRDAVKQTGEREDLVARIQTLDPTVKIWEPDDDTDTLSPEDDKYVRLLEAFVRNDPVFSPLVSGGIPELSIYWEEHGVRFKARIDYLTPHTVLDLKTYGQPPRRGRGLREHCVVEAAFNGYDLQAVHNFRAVDWALANNASDNLEWSAIGPNAGERIRRAVDVLRSANWNTPGCELTFRWLFLRMGGAPTGISIPFRQSDGQWWETSGQIAAAIDRYTAMRKQFGPDDMWLVTHGEQEIEDTDWPLAAIGGVR